jgi:RHS repeat-associated protein
LDGTGLYYYGARYYDPVIGRFISADTIVQSFANPQTLNRYSYCLNNPLKYTDPTGHYVPKDWSDPIVPEFPHPPDGVVDTQEEISSLVHTLESSHEQYTWDTIDQDYATVSVIAAEIDNGSLVIQDPSVERDILDLVDFQLGIIEQDRQDYWAVMDMRNDHTYFSGLFHMIGDGITEWIADLCYGAADVLDPLSFAVTNTISPGDVVFWVTVSGLGGPSAYFAVVIFYGGCNYGPSTLRGIGQWFEGLID